MEVTVTERVPAHCYVSKFSGVNVCEVCLSTGVCMGWGVGKEKFRPPATLGSEHPARRKHQQNPLKRTPQTPERETDSLLFMVFMILFFICKNNICIIYNIIYFYNL